MPDWKNYEWIYHSSWFKAESDIPLLWHDLWPKINPAIWLFIVNSVTSEVWIISGLKLGWKHSVQLSGNVMEGEIYHTMEGARRRPCDNVYRTMAWGSAIKMVMLHCDWAWHTRQLWHQDSNFNRHMVLHLESVRVWELITSIKSLLIGTFNQLTKHLIDNTKPNYPSE